MCNIIRRSLFNLIRFRNGITVKSIHNKAQPYMFDKNVKFHAATSYGGRQVVTMIPGIGFGPELMKYTKEACEASRAPIDFDIIDVDPDLDEYQDIEHAIISMRKTNIGIVGQLAPTTSDHARLKDLKFHQTLDLYVNVVSCKSWQELPGKFNNVDIVVIKQNRDGEYKMLEHESVRGVVSCLRVITRETAMKVAKYAFDFAKLHNRKKVTVIHKANRLKLSDGLFLKTAENVSRDYPEIKFDALEVNEAFLTVVMNPYQFDVILTMNLYGSYLINTICGLIGGHATVFGTHIGDDYIVFELATRSFLKQMYQMRKIVNPVPILLATSAMLVALGHKKHGLVLKQCVYSTIFKDGIRTEDWGGKNSGSEVMTEILKKIDGINMSAF